MPRGIPRAQNVEIPGAVDQHPEAQTPELPPDVQAMVDAAVAAALKQDRRARQAVSDTNGHLPTQAEALQMVNADPKRRSVLSRDGFVVTNKPVSQARDEHGFARE